MMMGLVKEVIFRSQFRFKKCTYTKLIFGMYANRGAVITDWRAIESVKFLILLSPVDEQKKINYIYFLLFFSLFLYL